MTWDRLLVQRFSTCSIGTSLAWINPATASVTVAIPARHVYGVLNAVAYYEQGKF